ncbi:hypothetical protein RSOLAG1IB_11850 [Rhizoctonia solani AG-1 IB]|uniref:Uncharacterized protein n=1 Tax=Thanatephorus cucumeris (strain AG1-IB / isolate 7/3/14) TaxID=1108050 RepID=A0A0B7FJ50_THACB|nr:hypothetical protein RSOLAG1IB_11850 [Rhizoctonia solani AG-1 IB]
MEIYQLKGLIEHSKPGAVLLALHNRDHSTNCGSLSPIITDKILAPIVQVETSYRSYEEAARQACLYVLTGKIDSGRSACLIKGKITDLGYKEDPSSDLIGFIQLEHNAVKKFHFSV